MLAWLSRLILLQWLLNFLSVVSLWHPVDNMLRDVYIYYGTSFIRVESFYFILSSWKKFWLNSGWNNDKILLGQ